MTDRENRDRALLNYVRALLDVPSDFPKEEIVRMFLEKKYGTEAITRDVTSRMERIIQESLSASLQ